MKPRVLPLLLSLIAASPVFAASPDVVVAAEREFAADAAQRGWVAAFKKYSAPNGIVFQPDPMNARASLSALPETPPDTSLKWWPIWAGVSSSGDLGFTTGPYTIGDGKGFGHYFTVWTKQPDGSWRWIYDGGPRNTAASPFGPETEPILLPVAKTPLSTADTAWGEIAAMEKAFAVAANVNAKTAYLEHLAADARIMGSPAQPAVGTAAISAELDQRSQRLQFTPLGGQASSAGDLVFTYGDVIWTHDNEPRRGHYVRIWQKRAESWTLVFDELLAAPPKKPSDDDTH